MPHVKHRRLLHYGSHDAESAVASESRHGLVEEFPTVTVDDSVDAATPALEMPLSTNLSSAGSSVASQPSEDA